MLLALRISYHRLLGGGLALIGLLILSACGETATDVPSSPTPAPATATTALAAETPTTASAPATATTGTGTSAGVTPSVTSVFAGPVEPGTLTGAGSTFVNPIMSKWSKEYNTLNPQVKINYQSIGSGGGRQQFIAKTVDFGASDAPLSDAQLQQAGGADQVLHIPVVMGAVVIAYNLPTLSGTPLNFSPDTIAGIYLGTITNWNDPKIAADNAGVTLPDVPIIVAHRSEGSGTTDIFTDYLSKVSPEWKSKVGRGTSVQWPVGIGGQGNEGVTNTVKNSAGGIGYIELAYAKQNKIAYGKVKNASGNFVEPTAETTTNAAAGLADSLPADLRYSITNAPGPQAYPISGTTWMLVYKAQPDANKGKLVAQFANWAVHDGQKYGADLDYAALPAILVQKVEAQLQSMTCGGGACLK
jgi:phosphate transport system substrate-binding protein